MPRLLLALFVALGVAVFAAPASAHGHGGHGGHLGHAAPVAAEVAVRPVAAPLTVAHVAAAVETGMTAIAAAAPDAPCDRDCAHGPAMAGCQCMAACVALALPDLPTIAPATPSAGPRPADAAPWRPTALVPPTPPPRA